MTSYLDYLHWFKSKIFKVVTGSRHTVYTKTELSQDLQFPGLTHPLQSLQWSYKHWLVWHPTLPSQAGIIPQLGAGIYFTVNFDWLLHFVAQINAGDLHGEIFTKTIDCKFCLMPILTNFWLGVVKCKWLLGRRYHTAFNATLRQKYELWLGHTLTDINCVHFIRFTALTNH